MDIAWLLVSLTLGCAYMVGALVLMDMTERMAKNHTQRTRVRQWRKSAYLRRENRGGGDNPC